MLELLLDHNLFLLSLFGLYCLGMAISTDATIEFFGTADEVISIAGGTVADGAFSDAGDFTAWTNDDDAPRGKEASA